MATEYDVFRALEEGYKHMVENNEPILSYKGADKRVEATTTFRAYGKVLTALAVGSTTKDKIAYQYHNRKNELKLVILGPVYTTMMKYYELLDLSYFLENIITDPGNYFDREAYNTSHFIQCDFGSPDMRLYVLEAKPGITGNILDDIESLAVNIIYDLIAEINLYYEFVVLQACTIGIQPEIQVEKEKELASLRILQERTLERKRKLVRDI